MSIDNLVEGVRKLDQKIVKDYTQLAKKVHLLEGKGKYWAGLGLNIGSGLLTVGPLIELAGPAVQSTVWVTTRLVDQVYNFYGLFGMVKDNEPTTGAQAKNYVVEPCKIHNKYVRLPTLLTGLGCTGAYVVNMISNGGEDTKLLELGLGFIALSSSMYLKAINPKLLQRQEEQVPWGATQRTTPS